jgi:hypothetical protein
MKRVLVLLVVGLLATVSVIAASPAGAKKGHPKAHGLVKKRGVVHGVVQAVGTNSITLKTRKGASVTVEVSADTKIRVNGEAGSLADVQVGYLAAVKLAAGGGPAKALAAFAPGTIVVGVVDSVGSNSITLKTKDGSSVTIGVTGSTKIRVNGKAGALADIEAGYRALVVRTSANGPAAAIRAYQPGVRGLLVKGLVDSVGTDSITIKLRNGASVTIAVTVNTQVFVSGHAGALSDIHSGYRALVLRAGPGGPALAIVARPPSS